MVKQLTCKNENFNKLIEMPAAKKRRVEQSKMIKLELKAQLDKERQELFECSKDRERINSIVDTHFQRIQDRETEVQRTLYNRMYYMSWLTQQQY